MYPLMYPFSHFVYCIVTVCESIMWIGKGADAQSKELSGINGTSGGGGWWGCLLVRFLFYVSFLGMHKVWVKLTAALYVGFI